MARNDSQNICRAVTHHLDLETSDDIDWIARAPFGIGAAEMSGGIGINGLIEVKPDRQFESILGKVSTIEQPRPITHRRVAE